MVLKHYMKHQRKTLILKAINKLPHKLGYLIYHFLQKKSFKSIELNIISNKNSIEKIKSILTKKNIEIKNKNIIEIGSGWLPIMPFLFKLELKISKISTYDINKHYSNKRVKLTCQYFKNLKFKTHKCLNIKLPDFIDYYPRTNIINTNIGNNFNLIYSRFVLEHVTPNDILEMHKKFYSESRDDIKIIHLISPSDHRAYSDNSLSIYDFLQYSDNDWNKIQTKFDYHNRLRLPEYLDIFNKTGFTVSYIEYDTAEFNSEKYKKYKKLRIHSDYNKFSEKEILAGSIVVLLEKEISCIKS